MKRAITLALSLGLLMSVGTASFARDSYTPERGKMSSGYSVTAPEFRLIKTFKGEDTYSITRPAFSKDGRYVAANLTETKTVRIWDTKTAEPVATLPATMLYGDSQLVDGLEFTPDNHLVVFRAGYPVKIINWQSQQIVRSFEPGNIGNKIEDYAFTPDYKWLVFATPNGVDLYDFNKGTKATHLLDGQHITSLDISRDGRWVAFGRKSGDIKNGIGVINLATKTVEKYPLSSLTDDQLSGLPMGTDYQIRHVSFEGDQHIMVGYMALPEGQYRPTGPAGVFRVDINNGRFTGPTQLSSKMLSFDPVMLRQPFNTTFINTFEAGTDRTESAAEFLSPDLSKIKTVTHADLNAPMMTFRVSPDQRWMAGSFKEPDGKVRLRLYEMTPERRDDNRMN